MGTLKATAKVGSKSAVGAVKRPRATGRISTTVLDTLPDYIQWRWDAIDPVLQVPMMESEGPAQGMDRDGQTYGSTTDGDVIWGQQGMVRPSSRYPCVYQGDGSAIRLFDAGGVTQFDENESFSIALWYRLDEPDGDLGRIFARFFSLPAWYLETNGGNLVWRVRSGSMNVSAGRAWIWGNRPVHIVCTVDRANDIIQLHVNGVLENQSSIAGMETLVNSNPLRIGSSGGSGSPSGVARGHFSSWMCVDRALTTEEILADYERGIGILHPHDSDGDPYKWGDT